MATDAFARHIRWLPNLLTILRLLLVALFPFVSDPLRAAVVVLGAASDFADGAIARRYGLTSWVGGLLDGIADKAFVVTVVITFLIEGSITTWQAAALLARDEFVLIIAVFVAVQGRWDAFRRMQARLPGKVATVALFIFMFAGSLWANAPFVTLWLLAITAVVSAFAGIDYLAHFIKCYAIDRDTRSSGSP